jgi:hypothetical protein
LLDVCIERHKPGADPLTDNAVLCRPDPAGAPFHLPDRLIEHFWSGVNAATR